MLFQDSFTLLVTARLKGWRALNFSPIARRAAGAGWLDNPQLNLRSVDRTAVAGASRWLRARSAIAWSGRLGSRR